MRIAPLRRQQCADRAPRRVAEEGRSLPQRHTSAAQRLGEERGRRLTDGAKRRGVAEALCWRQWGAAQPRWASRRAAAAARQLFASLRFIHWVVLY